MSHREVQEQKYKTARGNLLLAIIFTVLNIVLYFVGSGSMLLFSISVPYFVVVFGSLFEFSFMMTAGCLIAVIVLAVYLLCWIFSKEHYGWMIAALVLFCVDILVMAGLYLLFGEVSGIVDVAFHCWILFYLIVGVSAGSKLSKMPAEEPAVCTPCGVPAGAVMPEPNSVPMRRVGEDEKFRVLLEHTYGSYRVVYRRVKRVNQLVINDYIYDEIEMFVETPHTLRARINGQLFTVGLDNGSTSFFDVDGQRIAKKLRLI
jgi:hypothetical protein